MIIRITNQKISFFAMMVTTWLCFGCNQEKYIAESSSYHDFSFLYELQICTCKKVNTPVNEKVNYSIYSYVDEEEVVLLGKAYHPLYMYNFAWDKHVAAYVRMSNDTLFWLDRSWKEQGWPKPVRNEQILFVLDSGSVGDSWVLYTTSSLFSRNTIQLQECKIVNGKNAYLFTFESIGRESSDQIQIESILFSAQYGFISWVLTFPAGGTRECVFENVKFR